MHRVFLCALTAFVACAWPMAARAGGLEPSPPLERIAGSLPDEASLCALPERARALQAAPESLRVVTVMESEPNDTAGDAPLLPLSSAEPAVDLVGGLKSGDTDLYAVELRSGDWLNVATSNSTDVDTVLAVLRPGRLGVLVEETVNDDNFGKTDLYPAASLLLRPDDTQSVLTYIAPARDTYYIRVSGYVTSSTGAYKAQVRLVEGGLATMSPGDRQILYVDFDGATINPFDTFGQGIVGDVQMSPMSGFLPSWGLSQSKSSVDAVIDGVMAIIEEDLEALRTYIPDIDYELRNSRDHPDPWGEPNVSRLIIGGSRDEVGISTIGIAESIDPTNYERSETGIIMLDILTDPTFSIACQNQALGGGATILDAVVRALGNIAAHEAGHYLGAWHTDRNNDVACLIDSGGGEFERNIYDTGDDLVIGTADDVKSVFRRDEYGLGSIAPPPSAQNSGWRVASALRAPAACPADLNADGVVDGADLGALLGAWGASGATDLTGDGVTDGADLGVLLGAWGAC